MNRIVFLLFIPLFFSCQSSEEVKLRKYLIAGERLYELNCANCHQPDGKGFKKLYPPLAGADFLENFKGKSLCIMKYGANDTLVINGIEYKQPMPSPHLTDLELAEIATYVYNKWTDDKQLIDVRAFTKAVDSCKNKTGL